MHSAAAASATSATATRHAPGSCSAGPGGAGSGGGGGLGGASGGSSGTPPAGSSSAKPVGGGPASSLATKGGRRRGEGGFRGAAGRGACSTHEHKGARGAARGAGRGAARRAGRGEPRRRGRAGRECRAALHGPPGRACKTAGHGKAHHARAALNRASPGQKCRATTVTGPPQRRMGRVDPEQEAGQACALGGRGPGGRAGRREGDTRVAGPRRVRTTATAGCADSNPNRPAAPSGASMPSPCPAS